MHHRPFTLLAALVLSGTAVAGCSDAPAAPAVTVAESSGPSFARGQGGGGNVLPATARPHGYTLEEMATAMAYFSTSGNDLAFDPNTPFQILYVDRETGTNTFTVRPGTKFFIPVAYINDSPPIIGDFPTSSSTVEEYVLGPDQVGLRDMAVIVDGRATPIGAGYVAGPVFTPGLLDGGGSHFIQVGAFLTPLSKGTHTVGIHGTYAGAAVLPLIGGEPFTFEFSYTVIVR